MIEQAVAAHLFSLGVEPNTAKLCATVLTMERYSFFQRWATVIALTRLDPSALAQVISDCGVKS